MSKKRKTLIASGLLLVAMGAGYLSYTVASSARAKQSIKDLQSIAYRETIAGPVTEAQVTEPSTTEAPETVPQPETTAPVVTTKEKDPYVSPIDFEALWEINPDIYAWIEIPGTDVSYPILQHPTDNDYYLTHTPEGVEDAPASIFTHNVNSKDFTDFNTLIYGHKWNDGTMFGKLHYYRDEQYLKEHQMIRIYLPDRELRYTIFATVVYDDRLITSYYDFTDTESCRAFLRSIYGNRDMNTIILLEPRATVDDRLITLSTCIKWQEHNRYLVVAVLTNEIT